MEPCEVPGCKNMGQRHHIVFRSHGGLDISVNFKYLCADHHIGDKGPHKDRLIDLQYKQAMQERLFNMLTADTYTIKEIAQLIGYDRNRLEKRFKRVPSRAGVYEREDIVRALMGGRLY